MTLIFLRADISTTCFCSFSPSSPDSANPPVMMIAGGNNHNCQVDTLGEIGRVIDTIQSQNVCRFRIQWIYFPLETAVDYIFEYLVPELLRVR
jgi:hypothetical protein